MITLGNVDFPWEWEPWSKEMLCGHQEEPHVILHLSPFLVFKHKCLSCTQGNSSVSPCVPKAYIGILKAKDADLPVNNEWENHTLFYQCGFTFASNKEDPVQRHILGCGCCCGLFPAHGWTRYSLHCFYSLISFLFGDEVEMRHIGRWWFQGCWERSSVTFKTTLYPLPLLEIGRQCLSFPG